MGAWNGRRRSSGFLPGMIAGGMLGSSLGRQRRWNGGWNNGGFDDGSWNGGPGMPGGPVGPVPRRRSGCGTALWVLLGIFLIFALMSMCQTGTHTTGVNQPVVVQPVVPPVNQQPTQNLLMLDARAENDFRSADHQGQDVVNVPFDDYFEENAVYTIPDRGTPVEVCSYNPQTAAEIVTIMIQDLGFQTVTNAGTCGQ